MPKKSESNNPSVGNSNLDDFSDLSQGEGLKDYKDLEVSPNAKGSHGDNKDSLKSGASKAKEAETAAATAGKDIGKNKGNVAGAAADQLGKGLEKNKGTAEKKVDKKAGQAAEAATVALSGGTGTGTLSTVVGKTVEKVGVKRLAIAGGIIWAISLVPLFIIVYLISDPWGAVGAVLTNSKLREFGLDVAEAFGKGVIRQAIEAVTYTGEVEYKGDNTAIAAPTPTSIAPGSTLEKLSNIDWKKAQYQTLDNSDCGYELKLKRVVNAEGRTRHIPESVINKRTRAVIPLDELSTNTKAAYCIQKQYPIFNLMARQPVTREINQLSQVHLNYASKKDTEEFRGNYGEVEKYVYDKTLDRVTPAKDETIDFTPYQEKLDKINQVYKEAVKRWNANPNNEPIPYSETNTSVTEGINRMFEKMKDGTSPYDIQVEDYINIPTKIAATDREVFAQGLATTMCPFVYSFVGVGINENDPVVAENARKAIESRLASTQRGATKINTLSDTRKADQLSNVENNVTIRQQDNWASSTAYQLDVYNQLRGVQQNPEATSTRAYNARQTDAVLKTGIAGVYAACNLLSTDTDIAQVDAALQSAGAAIFLPSWQILKQNIKDNSEGVFNSVDDFGSKEVITAFMRTGSVSAVSGLEQGPDNYNRQASGFRQLMNDYYLRIGGRFLDAQEAQSVAIQSEETRRQEEKQGGIAYRLFDTDNIRSARSIISQNTITPKTALTATGGILKQILNPLRSLANIHSSALYYATGNHNRAFAANINGDQYLKIDTAGVPEQDFNINMLENASVIEGIKANGSDADKAKLTNYDTCMKAKIPTAQYFTITEKVLDSGGSGRKLQFFDFYPDRQRIINNNGDIIESDEEFDKFLDCKILLFDAKDFSKPDQQLPIRYRMYTYYNTILDMMVSLSSDEDDQSIYARSSSSASNDVLTEDVQELARQIIQKADEGRITFDPGVREIFEAVANGQPANTTCGNAGTPSVVPKASILQLILDVAAQTNIPPMRISAFTDACHTSGSHHYQGRAIDIGNEEIAGALMPYLFTNRDRLKIDDLFFDPLPQYTVDNGVPFGRTVGGHSNHIHVSTKP